MSSGELFALLDRAQNGDDAACEQVLQENAGLIWSIVRRYYGCGVETRWAEARWPVRWWLER